MNKLSYIPLLIFVLVTANSIAQNFDEYFIDRTLRIDYIFSGNKSKQEISLADMYSIPRWYGKRQRLGETPVEGNGRITVRPHGRKEVIYQNSFSTLFQEWLTYDDSAGPSRAFENVFLVPMPKNSVDITVELNNNRRQTTVSYTHTINPNDILIKHIGESNITPYTTLQQANDTSRCIRIAFVAEGYTKEEMNIFLNDAKAAMNAIFSHEPFTTSKNGFNVIAVMPTSKDSGTSHPAEGLWKSTALGSHFDTFYSSRYLTTLNLRRLHDALAGTPYEHIIILVNTSEYGGGGILNSYVLTAARNTQSKPVVVHEFGHSFGGLADEYAYDFEQIPMYPLDVEPWEQNITTLKDFHGKWEDMIQKDIPTPTPESTPHGAYGTVGLYEGAGYSTKGVFRGAKDCRMRSNDTPDFCPVCQRALQNLIDFYIK